ncbi:tapemeasure protein [Bacillus phage YungSlug]|nr:tapemeasure protein [Bacillus phage YungSlug]
MTEQEIGLKLKMDTADAVKDVKDLERAVNGIKNVERRGNVNDGFLDEKDVKAFRRMAKESEMIYKDFFNKYEQMKREFDRRKGELEQQLSSASDQTTINSLRQQMAQMNTQRTLMETQHTVAQNLHERGQQSVQNMNGMNQGGGFTAFLGNAGRNMMGMMVGAMAFNQLWGNMRQGMGQVKSEEEYMAMLGNRMEGYNGDYSKARKDAMNVGMQNGYKAQDTMALTDTYTSLAGTRGQQKTWNDVQSIQNAGRAMGVDPNSLAVAGGNMQKIGALKDGEQRKFATLLAGAIKKEGMEGRDRELIDAVSGLAQSSARGQVSLSEGELKQIVGLQAMLGSKEKGFKGQKGADVLSSIDQGIKGGDNNVDIMLGWGSEFQGMEGRAKIERMKARGITDPDNVKRIFSNIDKSYGGNKDMQQLKVQEMFGVDGETARRLLDDDILSELKQGGMKKEDIEKLMKDGAKGIDKKSKDYGGSDAARRAKNDANAEKSQKWAGEKVDAIWEPMKEAFFGLPEWAQWGVGGAGALGAGWLGKKAIGGVSNLFRGNPANGGGFWNNAKAMGSKAWEGTKNIGSKAWDGMKTVGSKTSDFFKTGAGSKAVDGAKSLGSKAWDGTKAIGSKIGDFFKGTGGKVATGAGEAGGGLMKTLGKFAGPVGTALSLKWAGDMGDEVGDWLFGHSKGDIKADQPLSNIGKEPLRHTDDRKSAFRRGWEWLTGEDNKAEASELSPDEQKALKDGDYKALQGKGDSAKDPKEREKEEKDKKNKRAQEELLDKERRNLDKRENLTKTDKKTQEESKKQQEAEKYGLGNIGAMSEKKEEGGFFSKMFKSIGGFFGGIGDGIMGLFGVGSSASADSGGGGNTYVGGGAANGTNAQLRNQNLKQQSGLTAKQVNDWIDAKAPQGSMMRGKGEAFVKASQESGLDVRYLVAHAAEETGWGTSNIAKKKGNMYGIGAFDNSPMASAYQFGGIDAGIIEGAKWIAKNYTNKGQDTLYKMRWNNGQHEYATNADWDSNIAKIMATAPASTLNVKVSGSVQGLTKENNNMVANAMVKSFSAPGPDLAYDFSRGVGGNR